jgi:hypothetical protein
MSAPAHVVDRYAIADGQVRNSRAHLRYDSSGFVRWHHLGVGDEPKNNAVTLLGSRTVVHVQVAAAQAGGLYGNQHLVLAWLRFLDLAEFDLATAGQIERAHFQLLRVVTGSRAALRRAVPRTAATPSLSGASHMDLHAVSGTRQLKGLSCFGQGYGGGYEVGARDHSIAHEGYGLKDILPDVHGASFDADLAVLDDRERNCNVPRGNTHYDNTATLLRQADRLVRGRLACDAIEDDIGAAP